MAESQNDGSADPKMDPAALFREDTYTDRKVGTIRTLTPVKSDGSPDPARKIIYAGEAQIMTNAGPLPINFEIDAESLGEAAQKFSDAAKVGIERAVRELQEMRRQAASSIVVPGAMPGGKIQIP
jgi:NCAIR mutase (PurE)-related protein